MSTLMEEAGDSVSETGLLTVLYRGLPPSFEPIVTPLARDACVTFDSAVNDICDFVNRTGLKVSRGSSGNGHLDHMYMIDGRHGSGGGKRPQGGHQGGGNGTSPEPSIAASPFVETVITVVKVDILHEIAQRQRFLKISVLASNVDLQGI